MMHTMHNWVWYMAYIYHWGQLEQDWQNSWQTSYIVYKLTMTHMLYSTELYTENKLVKGLWNNCLLCHIQDIQYSLLNMLSSLRLGSIYIEEMEQPLH